MKNLIAIAVCILLSTDLFGQLKPRIDIAPSDVNGTIFEYNPSNGDFNVYLLPEAPRKMTTIEIKSQEGVFQEPCFDFPGVFDIFSAHKLFKLDPAGFSEFTCDGTIQPGLSLEFLANDLTVDGSLERNDDLQPTPLTDVVFLIPEPSGACLFAIGLLFLGRTTARNRYG